MLKWERSVDHTLDFEEWQEIKNDGKKNLYQNVLYRKKINIKYSIIGIKLQSFSRQLTLQPHLCVGDETFIQVSHITFLGMLYRNHLEKSLFDILCCQPIALDPISF